MDALKLVGFVTVAMGVGFAIRGYLKYSDFLTHISRVSPSKSEALSFEDTEGWSQKNNEIGAYFWKKKYLGDSEKLNNLGEAVRSSNVTAIVLFVAGGFCILFGG